MERRLTAAAESERNERAGDEALLQRLKRDLKRTKALLRDTQAQLERQKAETPGNIDHLYYSFKSIQRCPDPKEYLLNILTYKVLFNVSSTYIDNYFCI